MFDAILFDLGDTLFDFQPMDARAVFAQGAASTYAWLQKRGCAMPPFEKYRRREMAAIRWAYLWAKLTGREFNSLTLLRRTCQRLGAALDEPGLLELAWQWYEPLMKHTIIAPDVAPTLAALRARGLKLGLVSNTFIPAAVHDRHLTLAGLLDFFPVRIYSSEVGHRKPNRRIFELALSALGTTAPRTLFVGDLVKTDIVGAGRMGMKTALRRPFNVVETHRKADYVIRNMSDLMRIIPGMSATPPA